MNSLHKIWVTLSALTLPRPGHDRDKGAGFVEYGAVIVLVALIAGVIMAAGIEKRIANGITTTIDGIFSNY
ncbi:hypothetical protein GCM10007079_46410 [Nocardiopsis terrae]|uniref:Flp pilus assembly pilin Flp n=1 Tax=Nocardiopsis terrae TaxID=372655 RepID=A0ABR9HKP3_9ACTN|nr:hypothetical protein [Nocardiopsis terrae]MBE1459551.1 Flp pilus assembly pilin Flp [Nocardiopsis terrae]GHC95107.1 hypothetical protein GCM10007079_46410 [Nocardiopsis terrae]